MTKKGRKGFGEWIDKTPDPGWKPLPLTHITRGLRADDIMRDGEIGPGEEDGLGTHVYLFYGRPAYRSSVDGVIKLESVCPYCFIFSPDVIQQAQSAYAFDTGAFNARMYSHVFSDDFDVEDYEIEPNSNAINRLVKATFGDIEFYLDADRSQLVPPAEGSEPWEMHARAYLELLASPGRNEPDDRICTIEVVFDDAIKLEGSVLAVIAPHTVWNDKTKSPLLQALNKKGVHICPYKFVPGRHPEHYQTLVELEAIALYKSLDMIG